VPLHQRGHEALRKQKNSRWGYVFTSVDGQPVYDYDPDDRTMYRGYSYARRASWRRVVARGLKTSIRIMTVGQQMGDMALQAIATLGAYRSSAEENTKRCCATLLYERVPEWRSNNRWIK